MNNIRKLRVMRKMTQQDLANEIRVERTSVGKYEKYDVLPSKEVLFRLADFFHVSVDYLLGRSADAGGGALSQTQQKLLGLFESAVSQGKKAAWMVLELAQPSDKREQRERGSPRQETSAGEGEEAPVTIPVVARAEPGSAIETIRCPRDLDADGVRPGDFAVVACGDSMQDAGIDDGDRVIVRPQTQVSDGEIALVKTREGCTIRRVFYEGKDMRLEPENPSYPAQRCKPGDAAGILGRVIQIVKDGPAS